MASGSGGQLRQPSRILVLKFSRRSLASLMEINPNLAAKLWHRLAQMLSNRLRNANVRYVSQIRDGMDVADELLGTRPLNQVNEEDEE